MREYVPLTAARGYFDVTKNTDTHVKRARNLERFMCSMTQWYAPMCVALQCERFGTNESRCSALSHFHYGTTNNKFFTIDFPTF